MGCGAPSSWRSPPTPPELLPDEGSCEPTAAGGSRPSASRFLLINPFEEGCFHDDLRAKTRQAYHSCGQFNNILASLLHALALSRLTCRTLVLPGFFVRLGARLTRVSPFAEVRRPTSHVFNASMDRQAFDVHACMVHVHVQVWRPTSHAFNASMPRQAFDVHACMWHVHVQVWRPTSHFFNVTMLRQAFDVIELEEWISLEEARAAATLATAGGAGASAGGAGATAGPTAAAAALRSAARRLPMLHMRGLGGNGPQLRFFAYHNLTFEQTVGMCMCHGHPRTVMGMCMCHVHVHVRWRACARLRGGVLTGRVHVHVSCACACAGACAVACMCMCTVACSPGAARACAVRARQAPSTFPHFIQQQSELRWVGGANDPYRSGFFSPFEAAYGMRWWRAWGGGGGGAERVLAFDAPPSLGLYMDHLRWDAALRYTRGHLRYTGAVHAEARRVRTSLFGDAPYLAVHIRRGADRLHDFCHTEWGKRCFGWNITLGMCYPSTESVAAQILHALRTWAIPNGNVMLATYAHAHAHMHMHMHICTCTCTGAARHRLAAPRALRRRAAPRPRRPLRAVRRAGGGAARAS